jgi:hypothetical protein
VFQTIAVTRELSGHVLCVFSRAPLTQGFCSGLSALKPLHLLLHNTSTCINEDGIGSQHALCSRRRAPALKPQHCAKYQHM